MGAPKENDPSVGSGGGFYCFTLKPWGCSAAVPADPTFAAELAAIRRKRKRFIMLALGVLPSAAVGTCLVPALALDDLAALVVGPFAFAYLLLIIVAAARASDARCPRCRLGTFTRPQLWKARRRQFATSCSHCQLPLGGPQGAESIELGPWERRIFAGVLWSTAVVLLGLSMLVGVAADAKHRPGSTIFALFLLALAAVAGLLGLRALNDGENRR